MVYALDKWTWKRPEADARASKAMFAAAREDVPRDAWAAYDVDDPDDEFFKLVTEAIHPDPHAAIEQIHLVLTRLGHQHPHPSPAPIALYEQLLSTGQLLLPKKEHDADRFRAHLARVAAIDRNTPMFHFWLDPFQLSTHHKQDHEWSLGSIPQSAIVPDLSIDADWDDDNAYYPALERAKLKAEDDARAAVAGGIDQLNRANKAAWRFHANYVEGVPSPGLRSIPEHCRDVEPDAFPRATFKPRRLSKLGFPDYFVKELRDVDAFYRYSSAWKQLASVVAQTLERTDDEAVHERDRVAQLIGASLVVVQATHPTQPAQAGPSTTPSSDAPSGGPSTVPSGRASPLPRATPPPPPSPADATSAQSGEKRKRDD